MAPAIECKRCEGFKVKTKTEPATQEEMEKLIKEIHDHSTKTATAMVNWEVNPSAHLPKYEYHEKTPENGFEDAKVVSFNPWG